MVSLSAVTTENATEARAVHSPPMSSFITSRHMVIIISVIGAAVVFVVIGIVSYYKLRKPKTVIMKLPSVFSSIYPHIPQAIIHEVVDIPRDDIWEFPRERLAKKYLCSV